MINYSIIIPHKNTPDLLQYCLDSIPIRSDVQVIVVDDNSDEDKKPTFTRDDVKFFYIDKEHTKGAGRARNVGLEHAVGKWYYNNVIYVDNPYFVDGDKVYVNNKLTFTIADGKLVSIDDYVYERQ